MRQIFLAQAGLEQADPAERYLWVDVEAHDDLLGDWDIGTLPALLIAQGDQPGFMGVLPPQIAVLARLVQSYEKRGCGPCRGECSSYAALWAAVAAPFRRTQNSTALQAN